jgi:hypothetical protein
MLRCQRGAPQHKGLDDILADCYYVMGQLLIERDVLLEKLDTKPPA